MPHLRSPIPAETIALTVLGFLAESDGALERFLSESGADMAALRHRAGEPEFLAAVMDFLLAHEDLAAAFCAAESLSAESLHRARRGLPGG